jgi:hypothetical protein
MAISFSKAFATYWGTEKEGEKFATVKLSTGDKQKDGTYINTNWFATFVGKALEKLDDLKSKDKIQITGKISNPYNKETKKSFLSLLVWDFEFSDGVKSNAKNSNEELDEQMPFN